MLLLSEDPKIILCSFVWESICLIVRWVDIFLELCLERQHEMKYHLNYRKLPFKHVSFYSSVLPRGYLEEVRNRWISLS